MVTYRCECLEDLGGHEPLVVPVLGDADQLPWHHGEGRTGHLQVGWGGLLHQGGDVLL